MTAYWAALQDGIDYIEANPEKAKAELAKWLQLDSASAEQVYFPGMVATIAADEVEPIVQMSIDMGVLIEDIAPDLNARITALG